MRFNFAHFVSGFSTWHCCLPVLCAAPRLLLASASQDKYIRIWAIRPRPGGSGSASDPAGGSDVAAAIARCCRGATRVARVAAGCHTSLWKRTARSAASTQAGPLSCCV
jgi:hypothetical protein